MNHHFVVLHKKVKGVFGMNRNFLKISCFLLVILLLCILTVGCKDEPDEPDDTDPPSTDGEDPPKGGDSGKEPENDPDKEPEEEYIPHTEPQMRQQDGLYSLKTLGAKCSDANEDSAFYVRGGNKLNYCRFADGSAQIVYRFDLHNRVEPNITLKIGNNYKIEISPDGKSWIFVYDWLDENVKCNNRSNETDFSIDPYEFEVYDQCYIRLSDSDPSDGHGACIVSLTFTYYEEIDKMSLNIFDLDDSDYELLDDLAYATPDSMDVEDGYDIHTDGGMIYNPISREKADQLDKYDDSQKITGTIERVVNGVTYTLDYAIPKNVTAYDAVPIEYTLRSSKNTSEKVYVSATAFEDKEREGGELYYDLTLPGTVDATWEYLGYVGGTEDFSNRASVTADPATDKQGKQYPNYDASELIRSGTVKQYPMLWWKFRYTNTGNTVWDGDGNGTFCFTARLYRQNPDTGKWEQYKTMENLMNRIVDEVYPGESGEMYFIFDHAHDLPTGEYKIVIEGLVRNETSNPENYEKNMWYGEVYTTSEFTFAISAKDERTEPAAVTKTQSKAATRNTWLHRYEEFMSSYDSHLRGVTKGAITDTMYLQCAPWTKQVVLKLIIGNGDTLAAVSLPVQVESDSIKITLDTDNENYVVLEDGTRFPAISAQSMADMRGNVQLGPDAAGNVLDNLLTMKEIGVNLINTTAAFEFDGSFGKNRANNIDACWFSLDAARLIGLKLEGWITYPYEGSGSLTQANVLFGTKLGESGFGSQDMATANGLNAEWQFMRWGDNYWLGDDNTVVLDVEDTRGWMRIDYNARHHMTDGSKQNFRLFLMDLYGDIESLNDDWETDYASFDEIDPEIGTTVDHGMLSYKHDDIVFGEWTRPLELLDQFFTLERIQDYKWVLETVEESMPTAKINVRTEGANWMVAVDPYTDSAHLRHVYYSQRRCAIMPELLANSGVIYSHSDYTTLPYTPSEVAELTKTSVENGIIPMLLPQFNRMRDIAINEKYGNDFSYEYNLDTETKGAYINTVCSAFEWFKATYENGGVPGILWQDYLCDGYATSTQRKEIAFFTEKLTEALNTPEGQEWATNFTQDASVLDGAKGLYTFDPEYVQLLIDKAIEARK